MVTANDVLENAIKSELSSRFALAQTISGTRSHHCFISVSGSELQMKRISADTAYTVVSSTGGAPTAANKQIPPEQLQPGQYVACMYDTLWYVGCITEHSEEHNDVLVNFMKHSNSELLS